MLGYAIISIIVLLGVIVFTIKSVRKQVARREKEEQEKRSRNNDTRGKA